MHAPQKIIDLSVAVGPDIFEMPAIRRKVINHQQGADLLGQALLHEKRGVKKIAAWLKHKCGKGVTHHDFPEGKGLSLMHYTLTTHTGTHMDAPYHYGDCDAEGKPAKTISDIPLEWCFNRGVLIDVSEGDQDNPVTCDEITTALSKSKKTLNPFDIVLLYTQKQDQYGESNYFTHYRGVTREVVEYLIAQGIHVIGIDSFSFDRPFKNMLHEYQKTKNKQCLWPAHFYGREKPYCQLERLTNLEELKDIKDFWVSCFPIKLEKADAAWCRVVAVVTQPGV